MKQIENSKWNTLPYVLILAVTVLRLAVSHPYNLVPVFSCLLFFGACRPIREFILPLLVLVGLDIFLTSHRYGQVLTFGDAVTWLWYLGAMFLGAALLNKSVSIVRMPSTSLAASVSFFLASNFTVWAEWGIYPKTLGGLGTCYIAALPFFRNSIVSETACSLLIISVFRYRQSFLLNRRIQASCS